MDSSLIISEGSLLVILGTIGSPAIGVGGRIGVDPKGFVAIVNGLVVLPFCIERKCSVGVGGKAAVILAKSLGEVGYGQVEILPCDVEDSAPHQGIGIVRVEPKGTIEVGQGFVEFFLFCEGRAPVGEGSGVVWIEPDGFGKLCNCRIVRLLIQAGCTTLESIESRIG